MLETGTAVLYIGHDFGALNLVIFMKSESEETYFALSVIASRNDMKFGITAYTVLYQATVISYLSAEC